jgi:hypothetical protein
VGVSGEYFTNTYRILNDNILKGNEFKMGLAVEWVLLMWLQCSVAQIAGETIISSVYAGTRKAVKLHLKVLSWNMSAMIGCRSLEEKIENANRNRATIRPHFSRHVLIFKV